MEENQKSNDGVLENLALLTDGIQTLFPDGKVICVFELNDDDFKKVQGNFRKIDSGHKKFSIDMSGVEHVFIHEDVANQPIDKFEETSKVEEQQKPQSMWEQFLSRFKSGRSSVK
jgi:hypothetical protein